MRPSFKRGSLLLIVAGAACKGSGAAATAADAAEPVVGAKTAVVTRQSFTETVEAIGVVTARPGYIAQLSAPAPARVAHVFVAAGQRVAKGAPLVEFERAPFDAQARSASVALSTAEQSYARAKRLTDAGILARKDLDQAANELAQAQANGVSARRAQELATLRAPIAGVVTRMTAVLGATSDPSQPVVEVADPSMLDILFTVGPGDAGRIRPGAHLTLAAGQRDSSESLGTGTVADVGATIDTASRGVVVRARAGRPSRPLRIGETLFGRIVVATRPNAVTVPSEALVPDGEGFKVFVVDSAHVAHATMVTVGARTATMAEITSGLQGGETIVTYGAYGVADSAKVIPFDASKAPPEQADAKGAEKPAEKQPVKPAGKQP
ncbi:MAG: efflux RND transporter periplasmic adaptor subunit [Gemmatimonadota bacterium]|nr:efflux RND transporter periplasmic adaptor subunit [Gemmatimonadota bacterium]